MKRLTVPMSIEGIVPTRIDMHIHMEPAAFVPGLNQWDVTYSEYLGDNVSPEVMARTEQFVRMFAAAANVEMVDPPPGYHFCVQMSGSSNDAAAVVIGELIMQLEYREWEGLRDYLDLLMKWNPDPSTMAMPVPTKQPSEVQP